MMKNAVSIATADLPFVNTVPEIIKVEYDMVTLSVDVLFHEQNEATVNLKFDKIVGFRVLDEGNLLEFWNKQRAKGWLWEVVENGWFDLEKKREGFILGYYDDHNTKEYIILGIDDCVSIITYSNPVISGIKNKDEDKLY
ncbi:hypothetical protein [Sphingobacterium sp. LRF_L2]|uniref:hypothetical protein n=1 Tax=Sphingobacterium sp. LRF_L2 TaxID=3369421 RepID=UPI003F61E8D1